MACTIALGIQHWWMNKKPASSRLWLAGNKPPCQITPLCRSKIWLITLTGTSLCFIFLTQYHAETSLSVCWVRRHLLHGSFFQFWNATSVELFPSHKICVFRLRIVTPQQLLRLLAGWRAGLLIQRLFKAALTQNSSLHRKGERLFTIYKK